MKTNWAIVGVFAFFLLGGCSSTRSSVDLPVYSSGTDYEECMEIEKDEESCRAKPLTDKELDEM